MAKKVPRVRSAQELAKLAEKLLKRSTCACNERTSKCLCKNTKLIKKDGKFQTDSIKSTGQ